MTRHWLLGLGAAVFLAGCNDMRYQPKFKPYDSYSFFEDGRSARVPPEDTVPRGHLNLDDHLYKGKVGGKFVETMPFPVTPEILARGRQRYDIFCSMCHGQTGEGNGMIVQRGFPVPPSYHNDRLRKAPIGHFFDVMTNGYGVMYSYGDRIPARDRWAIAAYIRVLQRSQNGKISDVPAEERAKLERMR
jgi:mono/diheme cytochrome c family protein